MSKLGVESDLVAIAASLLTSNFEDKNIPNFEELTRVVEGIAYYFIPPSLQSSTNPMCGMRDVLQNAKFQDQVKGTILELEQKIEKLKGKEVMGKIEAALNENPKNESLLEKKQQVLDAIEINSNSLVQQREELDRINSFFASFNDSIVLLGPEEKTFRT